MMLRAGPIIFLPDSRACAGLGHAARCSILATAFQKNGAKVLFLADHQGAGTWLAAQGLAVEEISERLAADAKALGKRLLQLQAKLVVLDRYDRRPTYELALAQAANAKLCAFDDVYAAHDCAAVLNPNLYASVSMYRRRALVAPSCKVLAGPRYALVRPRKLEHATKDPENAAFSILICVSGSDAGQLAIPLIEALARIQERNLRLIVVLPRSDCVADPIKLQCESYAHQTLSIQVLGRQNDLLPLLRTTQLAIVGAGSITQELLAGGIPFCFEELADNQRLVAAWLRKHKIGHDLGTPHSLSSYDLSLRIAAAIAQVASPPKTAANPDLWGGAQRAAAALLALKSPVTGR